MKLCENCNKPIELALLENNKETTVCGRCRGLDVNEFYDVIKKEIQLCNLEPEDKKRLEKKLLERTREISSHYRESLIIHEENVEKEITTQLQVETNKLASERRAFEQEKCSLLDMRKRLLSEQEELAGKNYELTKEQSYMQQNVQLLTKELNACVIGRNITNMQNDQMLLYVNPERRTEKSPHVIGKTIIRNNAYDVVAWRELDKNGQRYWTGYLNDVNGYLDGKDSGRRIFFRKTNDASVLTGYVSFGYVQRPIKLTVQEYDATNLIFLKGEILEPMPIDEFLNSL